MDSIFFSYCIQEFEQHVARAREKIATSALLKSCGLSAHHIDQSQEGTAEHTLLPEVSLSHISTPKYLICLIGDSLICDPPEHAKAGERTFESDIEQALAADIECCYVFLVGEQYAGDWRSNDIVDPAVVELVDKLEHKISLSILPHHTEDIVARKIVSVLEKDVMLRFGHDDNPESRPAPLNISGFYYKDSDTWPQDYAEELSVVFKPLYSDGTSNLLKDNDQRKQWIYNSLKLGHINEAQENIDRVLAEDGSDFYCCFWSARLCTLFGSKESNYQLQLERAQRALNIAREKHYNLLTALCLSYAAQAMIKLQQLKKAQDLLADATEIDFSLVDIKIVHAELNLAFAEQAESAKEIRAYLAQGADDLINVIRDRLSDYQSVKQRLRADYPDMFHSMDRLVVQKVYRTVSAMYVDWDINVNWANANFNIDALQIDAPNPDATLLQHIYYARNLAWYNYRLLSLCTDAVLEEHARCQDAQSRQFQLESCQQLLDKLEVQAIEANRDVTRSPQYVAWRRKEKRLAALATIDAIALIGLVFAVLFSGFAYIWAAGALGSSMLALLAVCKNKQKRYQKKRDTVLAAVKQQRQHVHNLVRQLAIDCTDTSLEPVFRDYLALLSPSQHDFDRFIADAQETLSVELANWGQDYAKQHSTLSFQFEALCHRIDRFEANMVSAFAGQFTQKIHERGQCEIGFKQALGSDTFADFLQDKESSSPLHERCLHYENNRLAAYTAQHDQASRIFRQLLNHISAAMHVSGEPLPAHLSAATDSAKNSSHGETAAQSDVVIDVL